jgi:MFS family permease
MGKVSPNYKWLVIGMLWLISFFNYADRQAITAVFPLLHDEMGLTKVKQGLLGSAFAWVYGLCSPFAGFWVDRVRRKTAILGGLHLWSFICLATALSRNFRHLFLFRAAEGLGETAYYPGSMSLISDYHGKTTRSRAMGFHQTSVYIGTIAGSAFAGLIGQHYGWRWSFVVFGSLGIVLGLALQRFLHEPVRGAAEEVRDNKRLSVSETIRLVARTPAVLLLMVAFIGANFVAMVLLTWMPTYLKESQELSLFWAGLAGTAFVQLASMAGSPVGGWLADTFRQRTPGGRVWIQALGVFGGAPFVFWCGQTQSLGFLIVALTAWGFFKGLYDANIFASAFDVVPASARGSVAGFMNMMGWLAGGGAGPVVIGFLAERYGLGPAISLAALVYVASGAILVSVCLIWFQRDSKKMHHGKHG